MELTQNKEFLNNYILNNDGDETIANKKLSYQDFLNTGNIVLNEYDKNIKNIKISKYKKRIYFTLKYSNEYYFFNDTLNGFDLVGKRLNNDYICLTLYDPYVKSDIRKHINN